MIKTKRYIPLLFCSLLVFSFSVQSAAATYGSDIYNSYSDTFGRYKTSSGTIRKFPILSQIEQGKSFQDSNYNYITDGAKGGIKGSLSLACGPMALLMLKHTKYKHDNYKNNETLKADIKALRSAVGINSDIFTTVYDLKRMAINLGISEAEHDEDLNHDNGVEFTNIPAGKVAAYNAIKGELEKGSQAIIIVNGLATTLNNSGGRHFMIIYQIKEYAIDIDFNGQKVKNSLVSLLDPWSGMRISRKLSVVLEGLELGDIQDYLIIPK